MRYFIASNGASVVGKQAFGGDDTQIDVLAANFRTQNPSLTFVEVNQSTFDSTPMDSAVITAASRAAAITELLSDGSATAKFIRAVLFVILDEINVIRALLPGPPAARTVTQLKTAVQSKINTGGAD